MSRYYCENCGRKRDEKFMKHSPTQNKKFCFREVKNIRIVKEISCYDLHIKEERERIKSEALKVGLYVQKNIISEIKLNDKICLPGRT